MKNIAEENIKIALSILDDEIKGDTKSALQKMHPNYSMTWVCKTRNGVLFPRQKVEDSADMKEIYTIKDRKYDIKNIVANDKVVMIEMIESYPDGKTGKVFKTPQVIVLEFSDGKIVKGRHYNDPDVSYSEIDDRVLENIYK